MRLWNDERERVARISEAALRAGFRSGLSAWPKGQQLAEVLRAIFQAPSSTWTKSSSRSCPPSFGGICLRHSVPPSLPWADGPDQGSTDRNQSRAAENIVAVLGR